ncbi:hypothetical protein NP603_18645 [Methylomonas sp. SURF-1]|uniref:DUF4239 domain-containing protein n=1 Tax=Methylomonas aurea TaxID=2952224 RepID=A0ABT1UNB4_9GAMM|nr:hypothetical protein [Methylomonas sp. SURF-1]MCQ8183140.1 hypothetical protein [Methylomonas sp. SURF-1]
MQELMYDVNSLLIALLLFLSMLLAIEIGYRLGLRIMPTVGDDFKAHVNATSASLLGILALLLGFTFSLSLQRYDSRSEAVVDEANAIGTAYLRAQLLAEPQRTQTLALLRKYVDLRVRTGNVDLTEHAERAALNAEAGRMQAKLWDYARQANAAAPSPVTTGLFIPALNDLIDNFGKRDAEMNRHVPEFVLLLLYMTFLMTGAVVGYATGLAGHRASFVTHAMVGLIVVLVFIIVDLDRPHRGLIRVSQDSLAGLQAAMREPVGNSGRE